MKKIFLTTNNTKYANGRGDTISWVRISLRLENFRKFSATFQILSGQKPTKIRRFPIFSGISAKNLKKQDDETAKERREHKEKEKDDRD